MTGPDNPEHIERRVARGEVERARWEGRTEAKLDQSKDRIEEIARSQAAVSQIVEQIRIELAKVTTKVAIITACASLAGGGIVAIVIRLSAGG